MTQSKLSSSENLFDFFHEQVDEALSNKGSPVGDEGVYYLTNLLVEKSIVTHGVTEPETLVEFHLQAQSGTQAEAVSAYRQLGDKALYTSGFFRDSLEGKLVSLEYYMNMGAAAYSHLSKMLQSGAVTNHDGHMSLDAIFAELSRSFEACSAALKDVQSSIKAESTKPYDDAGILKLYEEWVITQSPVLAERLREQGLVVQHSLYDQGEE